jgi:hypothetical protein
MSFGSAENKNGVRRRAELRGEYGVIGQNIKDARDAFIDMYSNKEYALIRSLIPRLENEHILVYLHT